MEKTLIDTWGLIAFINEKEPKHREVSRLIVSLLKEKKAVITGDIFNEYTTGLFRRIPEPQEFLIKLTRSIYLSEIKMIVVNEKIIERACQLRLKYRDHPQISFTDFTSMAVLQLENMTQVISGDKHFALVNLGFNVLPG